MTTFKELAAANAARHIEWFGGAPSSLLFRAVELAGETGEACNVMKKLERERLGLRGSRASVDDLAEELADVVICAFLAAMEAGVDLGAAVPRKFNKTSRANGLLTRMREDGAI